MFSPRISYGNPPIFLAGVGERMVEMVGEVADGFFVPPFHSRAFLDAETLPALARGMQRGGRGSTPAYRGVLEHHGHPELQPELNRLSKQGGWAEMMSRIDDRLLDALAVSGTPAEVAARLRERNAFADRTTLMLYNETEPGAVVDVVRALAD